MVCIRAFDWYKIPRPWITLNGTHSVSKYMRFRNHHKNLNEDRPTLSGRKCRPITLVSGSVKFIRIFAGVPWRGASNDKGAVDNSNFQVFSLAVSYLSVS